MKTLIVLALLTLPVIFIAQGTRQKLADNLYAQLSYYDALPIYEDLASSKNAELQNIQRTADCYRLLHNYEQAIKWYEKLEAQNALTGVDYMNYAQCLKTVENYTKANQLMQHQSVQRDYAIISKKHQKNQNYVADIKSDSARFTITNLELNSAEADFSPFIHQDEIYFTSGRRNVSANNKVYAWDHSYFLSLYKGALKDNDAKSTELFDKNIESKYHEATSVLSADGNTLYITRNNFLNNKVGTTEEKLVNLKIFTATKKSDGTWSELTDFAYNSDSYSVGHPALTQDGNTLYFVSDMPGGYGQTDLYVTKKDANGNWSAPQNLGESINTEGREMFPYVASDGTLFFSTDGDAGLGGLDVYMCFPERDLYFEPKNLGYPLNTSADDFGFYLNPDFKTGYVSSNRVGGKGKDDIYYFTSTERIVPQPKLEGIVTDEQTNEILANATLTVVNEKGDTLGIYTTNEEGYYTFNLNPFEKTILKVTQDNYVSQQAEVTADLTDNVNLKKDVALEPIGVIQLLGMIKDKETGNNLQDVTVSIKDQKTGNTVFLGSTNNSGAFEQQLKEVRLNDALSYEVVLNKTGYESLNTTFESVVASNKVSMNYALTPNKEVALSTGTLMAPIIYFDLDKYDIRPDASETLDKFISELKKTNSKYIVYIESHTDCRASDSYNNLLSYNRAKSTASYLKRNGIRSQVIEISWKGESQLTNRCDCSKDERGSDCDEAAHQKNRRSELSVKSANVNVINKKD